MRLVFLLCGDLLVVKYVSEMNWLDILQGNSLVEII